MDRSDASALADLQMHWDEAYTIGLDGDIWLATFHGSTDELRAHTSTELRELIRADYMYRQRARRVHGSAGDRAATDGAGSNRAGSDRADSEGRGADRDEDDCDSDEYDSDEYEDHFDGARTGTARTGTAARLG